MLQKREPNTTIILAIFRPADPVREVLRDYAFAAGHRLYCYDHLFDAMSCMPIMDNAGTMLIAARTETLTAEAVAAFLPLVNADATHYVFWLDGSDCQGWRQWPLRPANLHAADTVPQFDAVLSSIRPPLCKTPPSESESIPSRRSLTIQPIPLSTAELEALLGASL